MTKIIIKLNGKRKIEYEADLIFNDNGLVLDSKDEQMFITWGSIEYYIVKKEKKI